MLCGLGDLGLGSALEELRCIDSNLARALDFWASMDTVVDIISRRRDHTEVLLRHKGPEFNETVTSKLEEYGRFWRSLSLVCQQFAGRILREAPRMYAFLA